MSTGVTADAAAGPAEPARSETPSRCHDSPPLRGSSLRSHALTGPVESSLDHDGSGARTRGRAAGLLERDSADMAHVRRTSATDAVTRAVATPPRLGQPVHGEACRGSARDVIFSNGARRGCGAPPAADPLCADPPSFLCAHSSSIQSLRRFLRAAFAIYSLQRPRCQQSANKMAVRAVRRGIPES